MSDTIGLRVLFLGAVYGSDAYVAQANAAKLVADKNLADRLFAMKVEHRPIQGSPDRWDVTCYENPNGDGPYGVDYGERNEASPE